MVVLYVIITVVRQLLEPKVVSKQIGIHPIITLIAMYTGYKAIGILGMLVRANNYYNTKINIWNFNR